VLDQATHREKPALRPGEPVGPALSAIAHEILAEGRAALLAAEIENSTAIHDYRKAMKRWRAYLRLLEPLVPGAEGLRAEARDLAKKLSHSRDLQAALDALADLPEGELPPTSLATMRDRIEAAQRTTQIGLTAEMRTLLQDGLSDAAAGIDRWALDAVRFRDLAGALTHHYRRARHARPRSWEQASADDLHRLRRRVVEHRYQMELVEPTWPRLGKLWVAEAQRLRERLGSYQDLVVLGSLAAPRAPLAPWRGRLAPLIEARQAEVATSARRLADRLFAERPNAFRSRLLALWNSGSG